MYSVMTIKKTESDALMSKSLVFLLSFIFVMLFPFAWLLVMAVLLFINKKYDNLIVLIVSTIIIVIPFYMREYGVVIDSVAHDDVPGYVGYMRMVLADPVFIFVGGQEPLYWAVYYFLVRLINGGGEIYVFLNYCINIFLLGFAMRLFFGSKYLILFLLIMLLNPVLIYYEFHIFRQTLSFSVQLIGLWFLVQNRNKLAYLSLFLSSMFHVTGFIMLFFVWLYQAFVVKKGLVERWYVLVLGFIFLISVSYLIGDEFFGKIDSYEGRGVSASFGMVLRSLGLLMISLYLYLRFADKDKVLSVLSFLVASNSLFLLVMSDNLSVTSRYGGYLKVIMWIMVFYLVLKKIPERRDRGFVLGSLLVYGILTFDYSSGAVSYLYYGDPIGMLMDSALDIVGKPKPFN